MILSGVSLKCNIAKGRSTARMRLPLNLSRSVVAPAVRVRKLQIDLGKERFWGKSAGAYSGPQWVHTSLYAVVVGPFRAGSRDSAARAIVALVLAEGSRAPH